MGGHHHRQQNKDQTVINGGTAKAFGIEVPPHILAIADECVLVSLRAVKKFDALSLIKMTRSRLHLWSQTSPHGR
jgi:hypothetical protein